MNCLFRHLLSELGRPSHKKWSKYKYSGGRRSRYFCHGSRQPLASTSCLLCTGHKLRSYLSRQYNSEPMHLHTQQASRRQSANISEPLRTGTKNISIFVNSFKRSLRSQPSHQSLLELACSWPFHIENAPPLQTPVLSTQSFR
jgi:hypothetical protein